MKNRSCGDRDVFILFVDPWRQRLWQSEDVAGSVQIRISRTVAGQTSDIFDSDTDDSWQPWRRKLHSAAVSDK